VLGWVVVCDDVVVLIGGFFPPFSPHFPSPKIFPPLSLKLVSPKRSPRRYTWNGGPPRGMACIGIDGHKNPHHALLVGALLLDFIEETMAKSMPTTIPHY